MGANCQHECEVQAVSTNEATTVCGTPTGRGTKIVERDFCGIVCSLRRLHMCCDMFSCKVAVKVSCQKA